MTRNSCSGQAMSELIAENTGTSGLVILNVCNGTAAVRTAGETRLIPMCSSICNIRGLCSGLFPGGFLRYERHSLTALRRPPRSAFQQYYLLNRTLV